MKETSKQKQSAENQMRTQAMETKNEEKPMVGAILQDGEFAWLEQENVQWILDNHLTLEDLARLEIPYSTDL